MRVPMFAAIVILVLLVAVMVLPRLVVRATPVAKQQRRMEEARAEYRRSLEA